MSGLLPEWHSEFIWFIKQIKVKGEGFAFITDKGNERGAGDKNFIFYPEFFLSDTELAFKKKYLPYLLHREEPGKSFSTTKWEASLLLEWSPMSEALVACGRARERGPMVQVK